MQHLNRAVVALGGDALDRQILEYARMLAHVAPLAKFTFTHVMEGEGSVEHVRRAVEASVSAEFGLHRDSEVRVVPGERLDQLLETCVAVSATMILVGHHGQKSGRRSLARRLAMKAPCSLWMVPQGSRPSLERILTAVDFSQPSAVALSTATALAKAAPGAECLALHVYFDSAVTGYGEYSQAVRGREEAAFAAFTAPLELHGVRIRPLFEDSANVSHAIGRAATGHRATLVVMGTRGLGRSAAVLLGSETEQTIMETQVPVLVVKEPGGRMGLLQALLQRESSPDPVHFG